LPESPRLASLISFLPVTALACQSRRCLLACSRVTRFRCRWQRIAGDFIAAGIALIPEIPEGVEYRNRQPVKKLDPEICGKPPFVLAAALVVFHLGTAAMLPLYSSAVVAANQGEPGRFAGLTIVIAQAAMIGKSLIAMRMSEKEGCWLVPLILFAARPIRGEIAAANTGLAAALAGAH
jgi:hypothetical protein